MCGDPNVFKNGLSPTQLMTEKHELSYQASQAIRYKGYMIMTNRLKVIHHMALNGIWANQVLSK